MKARSSRLLGAAGLLVTSLIFPTAGFATTYPVLLNSSPSCCGSGPFGNVNITQDGTNEVDVTVTLTQTDTQFLKSGMDASFAFSLAGISSIVIDSVEGITSAAGNSFTLNSTSAGSVHMDGAGFFQYGLSLTSTGGSNPGGQTLSFDIQAAGITPNSFTTGTGGFLFAADVTQNCASGSPTTDSGSATSCAGPTGVVTNGGISPTPIPPAVALLGTVFGLGYFGLRRRRRRSAATA